MATVNKQAIAAAFGRAAAHYEQHADLQRQSADALLAMLPQRKYTHVLDAGCGPGWMSRHWRERHAQVTALDLSPPMLVQARQKDAADHAGDRRAGVGHEVHRGEDGRDAQHAHAQKQKAQRHGHRHAHGEAEQGAVAHEQKLGAHEDA